MNSRNESHKKRRPSGAFFRINEKHQSAFGELEATASFLMAIFLTFNNTAITGKKPTGTQRLVEG